MYHIVYALVSIIDFPTIITAIGSARTKARWKAILLALGAALLGELALAASRPSYEFFSFYMHRAIGQLIVATLVFKLAQFIRRMKKAKSN